MRCCLLLVGVGPSWSRFGCQMAVNTTTHRPPTALWPSEPHDTPVRTDDTSRCLSEPERRDEPVIVGRFRNRAGGSQPCVTEVGADVIIIENRAPRGAPKFSEVLQAVVCSV